MDFRKSHQDYSFKHKALSIISVLYLFIIQRLKIIAPLVSMHPLRTEQLASYRGRLNETGVGAGQQLHYLMWLRYYWYSCIRNRRALLEQVHFDPFFVPPLFVIFRVDSRAAAGALHPRRGKYGSITQQQRAGSGST